MSGKPQQSCVVRELEAALAAEDRKEKDFHLRQALQLVTVE